MQYSLKNFQKDFIATLKDPTPSENLRHTIIPTRYMKSKKRALLVYQDGYRARLTEALGETFEACWWVLGDDTFFALCASFVRAHPSLDYNLNSYGREFPEYLYNHKLSEEIPFLFDLASFEWSFKKLFECKQHTSLKVEEFALINDPNDMKLKFGEAFFSFHPSTLFTKYGKCAKKIRVIAF